MKAIESAKSSDSKYRCATSIGSSSRQNTTYFSSICASALPSGRTVSVAHPISTTPSSVGVTSTDERTADLAFAD